MDSRPKVARRSDKKLPRVPRPILAVDAALLTIDTERRQLLVVEMERADTGGWALPGTFLGDRETLAKAVERCLKTKLGVQGVRPQQLGVFDDPYRDDRDWVISVAHVAVTRRERLESLGSGEYLTRLTPVGKPGDLVWDHPKILRLAKEYVQSRYDLGVDPDRLLGPRFTLRELQQVHEAVAGERLDRIAFRRRMERHLVGTGIMKDTGGRPAELFRRRSDKDD